MRSRVALRALRSGLADHFELFLTTIGVLLAIGLTFSELTRHQQGVAVIFLVWLQGFLLWAVHRHSWFRRRALIQQLRLMLQDRINSQLTVLLSVAEPRLGPGAQAHDGLDVAVTAARQVSLELEHLSLESLRRWERRCGPPLPSRR